MKAIRPRRGDDNLFNDDWVVAEPDPGIVPKPSRLPAAGRFWRRKGRKCYELKNHLGNVLTVISDRKLGIADPQDSTVALYYEAEVLSLSDYYPFGMQQPGRSYSAGIYRYGFNGMEADDEIKGEGNSLDFGARMYDSRLGRWLSRDPLWDKQPGWSPYKSLNNSPMMYIDPDGGTEYEIHIIKDAKTGEQIVRIKTHRGVMTDGASHRHMDWGNSEYFRAYWYDYASIYTMTYQEDGSLSIEYDREILYDNGVRNTDIIWFYADAPGTVWRNGDPAPKTDHGIERSFGIAMTGGSGSGVVGQDWSKNIIGSINLEDLTAILKRSPITKDYVPGAGSWRKLTKASASQRIKFFKDRMKEGEKLGDFVNKFSEKSESGEEAISWANMNNQRTNSNHRCNKCRNRSN